MDQNEKVAQSRGLADSRAGRGGFARVVPPVCIGSSGAAYTRGFCDVDEDVEDVVMSGFSDVDEAA